MALDSDYYDSVFYDYMENNHSEIISEIKTAFHLFSAVSCVLIFISIPGNSFLLWVLLRERAWKTTSDILLLQLVISDLCFTAILPFQVCHAFHGWIFQDWLCGFIIGFFLLGLNSYVLILTAMTSYHYVAVVHALRLSAQAPKKICVIMASIVIWLVCAAVSIKASVNSEVIAHGSGNPICLHAPPSYTMLLFDIYMQIGLFFLIPFLIMSCCCVRMWITIRQCRMNRQRQASRLILGMIVVFFLCVAPYSILHFIISLVVLQVLDMTVEWTHQMHHVELIIYTLLSLYCCLNPLLHIFGAQRFRRHLPMPCNASSQTRDGSQNLSSMAVIHLHDTSV